MVILAGIAFGQAPPFLRLERLGRDPVLSPQGSGFESAGAFNPAVIRAGSRFVMLYRAQDARGTSRLGYAESKDGRNWTRHAEPALSPEAEYEKDGGVEDPRLVKIGNAYYLTYTAYNTKDAQLALAVSRDLIHWQRKGVILPAYKGRWNVNWTKSGAILDRKINGHYWMYFMADARDLRDQTGVAWSDDKLVYRTGWALFDLKDPSRLLARSDQPIFEPELDWEKKGQVPNVVFVEGMVRQAGQWLFWYGGADKFVGAARGR